jgi:hypothetical protein
VGGGPDVRRDLAGLRVRRVRDRRVRPPDRRLAGIEFAARSDLALDALEQALYDRPIAESERLVHHSDRGVQYLAIRYTERLAEADIEPSVGTTGDSYDNALAESVIGLYKTEEIHRRGPWKGVEDVEFATLEWVAWYNTSRLLEPIGYVSPNEFERAYYNRQPAPSGLAGTHVTSSPENPARFIVVLYKHYAKWMPKAGGRRWVKLLGA